MTLIFISYQRAAEAEALEVNQRLKAAGFEVWQDVENIRHTARWSVEINSALNKAERIVLLLTPASMSSDEVFNEWFFFYTERKAIHCLMLETCKPHYQLNPFQWLEWRQADKRDWNRLFKELQAPFDWPSVALAEKVINSSFAPTRTLPEALAALLQAVRSETSVVALNDTQVDQIRKHHPADLTEYRLGRIAEWSQPRYQLDNRFVNLTLLIDQGEEAQGTRFAAPPESRRFNDLRDVLAARPDDPVLVLLGAPGSGKSTLLRRLQLDNASDALRGKSETVMFFVPLNAYRADSSKPRDWLNAEWTQRYPALPTLNSLLAEGRVLLLLDALNEMPHNTTSDYFERVGVWREFIGEIVPRGNRAVFSCRSLDYSASLSSKDLRVPQIVVQPMTDDQIQQFLTAYLPARAESVWQGLKDTAQREIFRTPYFLKLLCEQVEANEAVPQGRASLFTGFVRQALEREISSGNRLFLPDGLLTDRDHQKLTLKKWRDPFDLPERGALMTALSQLAYAMQEKGLDTDGAQVRVDYDEACDLLSHDRQEDILKAGLALNVLDEDLAQAEILFFHQLLQEFFAARRLAENPKPELVQVAWQVGQVTPTLAEILATLADSDPLPLLPQTGWEETTLLAAVMNSQPEAFVRALLDVNLPLAARCAALPELPVLPALKRDIQRALMARTQDMTADLRARMAAGLALGTLGDPRFEHRTGPHGEYLLPPLVTISGGDYPIGSEEQNDEKPPHTVPLDPFQIGMFPVTNAEYAWFMAAGGYDDAQWWDTDAAQAWRTGEGSTEGQKQTWRDNWKTFQSWTEDHIHSLVKQNRITSELADTWLSIRALSQEELETQLDEAFPSGKRYTEPAYWNDEAYNNPAQPAVGICWHEARAYCAWLAAQTGQAFRLPTEVELEAAARSSAGRTYAYGETFDSARSNTFESHIRRATPVGIFNNAILEGVFDLSGNVYTWTSSAYEPYPYRADDGRENAQRADVHRVVRGGSWDSSQGLARAAARNYYTPGGRNDFNGFRGVVGRRPPSVDQ